MKIYAPTTRATSLVGCLQSNGAPDSAPVDFDPAAHPIIARHFFGVEAFRQFGYFAGDIGTDLKRQRRIEHVWVQA